MLLLVQTVTAVQNALLDRLVQGAVSGEETDPHLPARQPSQDLVMRARPGLQADPGVYIRSARPMDAGKTLVPGLYKWSTGVLVTNAGVTLNGQADDVWVFQIAQNLTINNGAIIHLSGGALAKNVFWVVSGKATLGTTVNFSGVILSKTLISLNTSAKVTGRLLAQTAVTLIANTVKPNK